MITFNQKRRGRLINMDTSRIQTAIEVLLKSPLFNFSLASKELFHSNFLAWIFEQRDNSARNLLKKIAPEIGEPQFDDSFKIEREKIILISEY